MENIQIILKELLSLYLVVAKVIKKDFNNNNKIKNKKICKLVNKKYKTNSK